MKIKTEVNTLQYSDEFVSNTSPISTLEIDDKRNQLVNLLRSEWVSSKDIYEFFASQWNVDQFNNQLMIAYQKNFDTLKNGKEIADSKMYSYVHTTHEDENEVHKTYKIRSLWNFDQNNPRAIQVDILTPEFKQQLRDIYVEAWKNLAMRKTSNGNDTIIDDSRPVKPST